ncbi:winged helix-turn-helix domain-containing protein [Candidatus Micrarchaeota archaeon]|nr:winged helix-turn-helix domain-containing protein [Candidatus Micrarchaeota archaeon]MBU1681553.1 winged helix-turn-helix domain-containing protein [Candidatus Micrarchaeota archaeon]
MDDDKIVLDRKSFEALAVDTRVKILKSLKERRKTLTEISKEQNMSVSGIKEHLETLEKVGLIEKIDDGHKWKYYELTKKGKEIVSPREVKVFIMLSISLIALIASAFFMFPPMSQMEATQTGGARVTSSEAPMAAPMAEENAAYDVLYDDEEYGDASAKSLGGESQVPEEIELEDLEESKDNRLVILIAVISLATILSCLGILFRNRMH